MVNIRKNHKIIQFLNWEIFLLSCFHLREMSLYLNHRSYIHRIWCRKTVKVVQVPVSILRMIMLLASDLKTVNITVQVKTIITYTSIFQGFHHRNGKESSLVSQSGHYIPQLIICLLCYYMNSSLRSKNLCSSQFPLFTSSRHFKSYL